MMDSRFVPYRVLFCLFLAFGHVTSFALTADLAARIAAGESEDRIAALNEAVVAADPALGAFVQALLDDEVKLAGGKAYIVKDGKATDAATGAAATLPADAEDVVNNNRVRREFESAAAALQLFSPDRNKRSKAIDELKDGADEASLSSSKRPLLPRATRP